MELYPIITQNPVPASQVPTPKTGHFSKFFDASNSNKLSIKDSNGTVTELGGNGGGASILYQNSVIDEASWSGNTIYAKNISVPNAVQGDYVIVTVNGALLSAFETENSGWSLAGSVTANNVVRVIARVPTYITIPVGAEWLVSVLKP